MDAFQRTLWRLTCAIAAERFRIQNERHERQKLMAIEIKGLKGKALKAGSMFDRLNRAYDKLIETGDAHADDVEGLAPQITAMQDDISFAVQTLGNSVSGSGNGAEKPQKPPVMPQNQLAGVGDLNQPKVAPESIVGQQSAFAIAASTGKPIDVGIAVATPEATPDARVFDRMG